MAMSEAGNKAAGLEKFKYPLIILAFGLVLMLLPGKSGGADSSSGVSNLPLKTVLSCTEGVGRAEVIVSESGVVIVCDGADNAKIRLDIIRAVGAYTGFSSDKITILKMN